jgi:hypothetical protein
MNIVQRLHKMADGLDARFGINPDSKTLRDAADLLDKVITPRPASKRPNLKEPKR